MNNHEVIIIGSGLGGLLCGYILSKEGMDTCILEKNKIHGGALQSFQRKGINFDTGVHYIGGLDVGQSLHQYFRYFGLIGNFPLQRLNKNKFDLIAFDDAEFPLAQGFQNFTEQLLPYFPKERKNLEGYISSIKQIVTHFPLYNLENPDNNSEEQFRNLSAYDFFSKFKASHPENKSSLLLPSVLAGNMFLYSGNRNKTPLYIPALINHSFISSAWRPTGGSNQIADLLFRSIKNAGGSVLTERKVNRIGYNGTDFTVQTDTGEVFSSRYLISDIHPSTTISLMNDGLFRKSFISRIRGLANTVGAFTISIVLKPATFEYLDYNYYYHKSGDVWGKPGKEDFPANYLLITPVSDETGKFAKNLVIMTTMDTEELKPWKNTNTGHRGSDYNEFKYRKAIQVLSLVEKRFLSLKSKIEYMDVSTPLTWRDYTGTPGGSMYGIQHDFNQPLQTRILPKTKIPNFLFTGQNINIHGVMGVTAGAVMTCGEILGIANLLKKIRNA